MKAVYRECNDQACAAFRLDLPHSHLEDPTHKDLEAFRKRWEAAHTHSVRTEILLNEEWVDATKYRLESEPKELQINGTWDTASPVNAWLTIPLDGSGMEDLMQRIGEYVTWVETGMTADVCKCEWIQHPDSSKPYRSGDTALDCPAHAKEGLVLGFFTWLRTQPMPPLPYDSMMTKPAPTRPTPDPEPYECTLGNVETIDAMRTCCNMEYPTHALGCPEAKCSEHGY